MDLQVTKKIAIELLIKHELMKNGWTFDFDRSIRRFGCCHHTYKQITLSKQLAFLNNEPDVLDTILHEIAHALVGPGHGHGFVWKQKAKEIGCNGDRLYHSGSIKIPPKKYVAICSRCGSVFKRIRMTRRKKACTTCCNKYNRGFFDIKYLLTWKRNIEEAQNG